MGAITELNLSSCQPNSLVDRINAVPGLKTSTGKFTLFTSVCFKHAPARNTTMVGQHTTVTSSKLVRKKLPLTSRLAFLTFLRANLVLAHSAMASNVSTPTLGPHPSLTLPPVSSSALVTQAALADDIPPLSLELLTTRADKAAALRLIADSIAQQGQSTALHLALHPLPLAAFLATLTAIYHYTSPTQHDLGTALMVFSGACMIYLLVIRFVTSGYQRAAEDLSRDFLTSPSSSLAGGQEDLILGTRHGPDLVGALVLRLERSPGIIDGHGHGRSNSSGSSRRKAHSRQGSLKVKGGKGVIRAWTTRRRYRRRGLGADMLREAARVTRERCGRDAEVGFAREHANSVVVLPEVFNRPLRRGEMQAARALERVLREWDGRRR